MENLNLVVFVVVFGVFVVMFINFFNKRSKFNQHYKKRGHHPFRSEIKEEHHAFSSNVNNKPIYNKTIKEEPSYVNAVIANEIIENDLDIYHEPIKEDIVSNSYVNTYDFTEKEEKVDTLSNTVDKFEENTFNYETNGFSNEKEETIKSSNSSYSNSSNDEETTKSFSSSYSNSSDDDETTKSSSSSYSSSSSSYDSGSSSYSSSSYDSGSSSCSSSSSSD